MNPVLVLAKEGRFALGGIQDGKGAFPGGKSAGPGKEAGSAAVHALS